MKARPTVLGLMGIVGCVAVGLAAVRHNDEFTAAAVFALTFFILCTSALIAIYRRGAWAGFAVFGWAQFLICQPNTAPALGTASLPNRLVYLVLIQHVTRQRLPPPTDQLPKVTRVFEIEDGKPILVNQSKMGASIVGFIPVHGLRTFLCLSSLVVGLLGAAVGNLVTRRFAPRVGVSGEG